MDDVASNVCLTLVADDDKKMKVWRCS